jgi:hypothetical protein
MDTSKMQDEEKRKLAVGYLVTHKEEAPEGTGYLFSKLEQYDERASNIYKAIQEAKKSISELSGQMQTISGSIGAIVDLIGESVPDDKLDEWSGKFDPQMGQQSQDKPKAPNVSVVGTAAPKIIQ